MLDSSLIPTLADYLAGEFDNREQALSDPVWFVHLRLWQRPVPLFTADSLTLFAEQANVLTLDQPYRQRLLRLQPAAGDPQAPIQVQYYAFKDPTLVKGAGQNPQVLQTLTTDEIDLLPGCVLQVTPQQQANHTFQFMALPPPGARCYFTYEQQVRQVALGFEVTPEKFLSYDKGVDPETGKALWGAIMGPYQFTKRQSYPF